MKIKSILSVSIVFLFASCAEKQGGYPYHVIPRTWVYNIKQHNDSIYFSTSEDGIFRFPPDHPEAVRRVAACGKLPFRSIVFRENGALLVSSYYSGVYLAEKDTLVPILWAQYPAWSMKQDAKGALWLAGTRGVFFERNDSMLLFKDLRDAHDIAFSGSEVAVAHMQGISLFNRENGTMTREFCKGVVCWAVTSYDSCVIAGGLGLCAIITGKSVREIRLASKVNMVWAIEKDPQDTLFLGTQKGLFRVAPGSDSAQCIGFPDQCIKSLFIDKSGKLWAGRFYK
jgi:ligand-binding sensor domain-containing protein